MFEDDNTKFVCSLEGALTFSEDPGNENAATIIAQSLFG